MKKLLFTGLFLLSAFVMIQAQDSLLRSKRGIPILPKAGDFAIGISATPFLNFIGNAAKINSTNVFNSPASFDFVNGDNVISGKYFWDKTTAFRGQFLIGRVSTTQTNGTNLANGSTNAYVNDTWTSASSSVTLGAGVEKRRGYGRLQAYYGAQLMLSLTGGSTNTFTYGNPIDSTYQTPKRTNFAGQNNSPGTGTYVTERKTQALFGLGITAFVGVEYFFAPKMSVGGEFGWGFGFNQGNVQGPTTTTTEAWQAATKTVVSTSTETAGKTSNFIIDTYSTAGNIFLMFYF
jgi:hypothetical protein